MKLWYRVLYTTRLLNTNTWTGTCELFCSGTNRLLISDFRSLTRGERQFLKVFRNHTMLTTSFNGRNPTLCPNGRNEYRLPRSNPKIPNAWSDSNFSTPWSDQTSTVCHWGRQPNCLPTWPKVNSQLTLFQNLERSQEYEEIDFWQGEKNILGLSGKYNGILNSLGAYSSCFCRSNTGLSLWIH